MTFARDYDPATARFTAMDPVAVPTGMPYVSGYLYAFDNPLTGTDTSGRWSSNCGVFSQACDSGLFGVNEIIGFGKGVVGTVAALLNPVGTYQGIVDSCNAGFAQYGGNGPSFEGFLQCVDNLNPITGIRNQFSAALNATTVEDSGQAFGKGLLGTASIAAPFAKGRVGASGGCSSKLPQLVIDDAQFGAKVGKHAEDFGLNPADPAARDFIRNLIVEVHANPSEVRQGPWNPQGGGATTSSIARAQMWL